MSVTYNRHKHSVSGDPHVQVHMYCSAIIVFRIKIAFVFLQCDISIERNRCIDQWLLGSGSDKHDTTRCPLCKENALPSPSVGRLCEGCKRPVMQCRSCGLGVDSRDTFEAIGKEMLGYSDILDGVLSSTIHRQRCRHPQKRTASSSKVTKESKPVVIRRDKVPEHSPPTVLTSLIRNPLSPLFPFFNDSTTLTMDPLCLDDVDCRR